MTTTRIYRSTDGGAPVLTGQVSKMIDLIKACLVDGYNAQTVTITRTGDTATAACTAHGYVVNQVVLISGATPSAYNGEFRVLTKTANDFTFEVLGTPTTPATGTISCLVAPAGWTRPYSGTDKAAFRNSLAAGGTGMYLRVLDDASLTGAAINASVRAYLTMTDVDTGTIETPTAAQLATGIVWRKSNTADATARPWILVADELTFYACIDTGTVASEGGAGTYAAGDFASYVPGDAYRVFVAGRETATPGGYQDAWAGMFGRHTSSFGVGTHGVWLARGYAGTGDAVRAAVATNCSVEGGVIGGPGLANPPPGSGLQFWSQATIVAETEFRGRFRGIYAPETSFYGVAIGTDIVNPPGLSATLTTLRHNANTNVLNLAGDGHVHVDITSAWAT